ncbi:hypothetical protein [Sphingomonas montanisoli]|uniref:Class I SAM-dependent methyltransferase n=1 Tax=Sphingomonas montanisoli TaxID=2606412 RepID=A0A5D9C453_9SPHN|nr:hypothetical protein [Sphingomonas montanisoli]TZG26052.1 hypothetical protein FYJ91_13885 [Sphingomonas montanisoli]
MGIGLPTLDGLLRGRAGRDGLGRTIQIGRQGLYITLNEEAEANRMLEEAGITESYRKIIADTQYADEALLPALGATEVITCDNSDYEGAALLWDMNDPIPRRYFETFDTLLDGGSLEHIFNVPQALANMMNFLAVSGRIISVTPSNNWLGHGFYQFGPELPFRVFQQRNGFEVNGVFLAGLDGTKRLVQMFDRGAEGSRNEYGHTSHAIDLVYVATKIAAILPFRSWPQQGDYESAWHGADMPSDA